MKYRTNLTAPRLREVLYYDSDTGIFRWRVRLSNCIKAGAIAGHYNSEYLSIHIDGHSYLAHRLAWLYIHERWPAEEIDHINGIKRDNRFVNLREATHRQNMANVRINSGNKSGFKGVSRDGNGYRATVANRHVGTFPTAEQASRAYLKVARELFGEFYRDAA